MKARVTGAETVIGSEGGVGERQSFGRCRSLKYSRSEGDQGGDQAVPLADRVGEDEPLVALAVLGQGGGEGAFGLQVNHQGVNGALVAAGVHSQGEHQVAAGHRSVLDQGRADGGAEEGGEHRSVSVGDLISIAGRRRREGVPGGHPQDCHSSGPKAHSRENSSSAWSSSQATSFQ